MIMLIINMFKSLYIRRVIILVNNLKMIMLIIEWNINIL